MKVALDIGHNCHPDTGAIGIKSEDSLTSAVGNSLADKLKAQGHQVILCCPSDAKSVSDSLSKRAAIANMANAHLFISIHFNAFNGKAHGTEVFTGSSRGQSVAKKVVDAIAKLGFHNRGIKDGSHLFVLKNTRMPGILIECCFIDSAKDMEIFDVETMATAIASTLS
jgi:N-acetylmuramoyl-L-alanine amidase